MRQTIGVLFLALIGLGSLHFTSAEVSHEDIRGTLQSLIYSYNQLDSKLERHEHRERALGELMKKAMQGLQKGQKNLEPLNGIFSRLDERVSQIETMLMTQEERYNLQAEKLGEALENIFKWMHENDECMKRPPLPPGGIVSAPVPAAQPNSEFIKQQEKTNAEMLQQLQKLSADVSKLVVSSDNMVQQTEVAFKTVPSTAEILTKIEDKLVSYSVATPAPESTCNKEFESKVLEKFENLSTGLSELKDASSQQVGLNNHDKEFIQELANETLAALENVKSTTISSTENAIAKSNSLIQQVSQQLDTKLNNVSEDTGVTKTLIERFYNEMNATNTQLKAALDSLDTFSRMLMTNSEVVLDTQRKVDFGTVTTVQKIANLLEKQREEIMAQSKNRFDNLDENMVSIQFESMQNLTSMLETEIGNVWQQIAIMHGEITDSKDLLLTMTGRNEANLNSTMSFMEKVGSKVEAIKGRMLDMDSNLNFLLGKLSIMSQEFQNIKMGLAESLDQLRNTFHTMQEKMPNNSATGPHNIAKNAYETEVNLLQKRNTN